MEMDMKLYVRPSQLFRTSLQVHQHLRRARHNSTAVVIAQSQSSMVNLGLADYASSDEEDPVVPAKQQEVRLRSYRNVYGYC